MLKSEGGTYTRCQLLMVSHEMGNKTATDIRVTESYYEVRDSEAPSRFTEKRLGLLSALRRHVETRFQVRL